MLKDDLGDLIRAAFREPEVSVWPGRNSSEVAVAAGDGIHGERA